MQDSELSINPRFPITVCGIKSNPEYPCTFMSAIRFSDRKMDICILNRTRSLRNDCVIKPYTVYKVHIQDATPYPLSALPAHRVGKCLCCLCADHKIFEHILLIFRLLGRGPRIIIRITVG